MKKNQFLFLLVFIFTLQACGQTGDLYHPEEPTPVQVEKEES